MSQSDLFARSLPAPSVKARFDGAVYSPAHDDNRLSDQLLRIKLLMADRHWRTLAEIESATGAPAASVSAQLRHLRKARFGSYLVERRSRGDRSTGLFEYRVLPPDTEDAASMRSRLLGEIASAEDSLRRAHARIAKATAQLNSLESHQ